MDFNQWEKLLEVFLSFFQTISWPLIVLFIVLILRTPLKKFLGDIIEFNLKAGPIETTAKRQQIIEVAASLGAATAVWQVGTQNNENIPTIEKAEEITNVVKVVDRLITPAAARQLEGSTVLWVDDKPINNTYERKALQALGIQFTISKSTENALEKLKEKNYDLIISDMGRPPDQKAGYTLLEKVKAMHITTPFIIYAGSKRPEHIAEARRRGAFGTTNDPQELFELVISALKNEG
jgi:CheY-like chemotaxis protein